MAIQYRYMEAAALVQLLGDAEELSGLRGRDLKRRREFWESRLRGTLTVLVRRMAFGPWLPYACGASHKMSHPEDLAGGLGDKGLDDGSEAGCKYGRI